MTAIPCGQKKRRREMIQSQMVTPPLAAIEGTTLRLKTATTKRRTRSRRPRARMSLVAGWVVVDKVSVADSKKQILHTASPVFGITKSSLCFFVVLLTFFFHTAGTARMAVPTSAFFGAARRARVPALHYSFSARP